MDGSNGPGTDFTTLAVAEALASDGDTLRVRGGFYLGFETSKGIRVVGERGSTVSIRASSTAESAIHVHDLAAGSTFAITGCRLRTTSAGGLFQPEGAALYFLNCQGSIVVEDTEVLHGATERSPGIRLDRCAQVHVLGCTLAGSPAIMDDGGSHLTVVDSELVGGPAILSFGGGTQRSARSALELWNTGGGGTARLVRTTATGGNGTTGSFSSSPPVPAILVSASRTLILTGDASAPVAPGFSSGPLFAVADGSGAGFVIVDPAVSVQGAGGAPAFEPNLTLTTRHVPWLVAAGDAPGGNLTLSLVTTPLDPVFLLLGEPAVPTPSPFGPFELGPQILTPLFSGAQPAGGVLAQSFAIPADTGLFGLSVALQGGVFDLGSSTLELTNAVVPTIY